MTFQIGLKNPELIDCARLTQVEGKTLEKNQQEKLSKEAELLAELDQLKLK